MLRHEILETRLRHKGPSFDRPRSCHPTYLGQRDSTSFFTSVFPSAAKVPAEFFAVTGSDTSPATTTLNALIILVRRQQFWLGYDVYIKMYNCMVHGYPQSPIQSHQPSPSRSTKRKFHNDEDASTSPFCSEKVDSLCSQPISTPRTQQTLALSLIHI